MVYFLKYSNYYIRKPLVRRIKPFNDQLENKIRNIKNI